MDSKSIVLAIRKRFQPNPADTKAVQSLALMAAIATTPFSFLDELPTKPTPEPQREPPAALHANPNSSPPPQSR